jgi:hypothetical protein
MCSGVTEVLGEQGSSSHVMAKYVETSVCITKTKR